MHAIEGLDHRSDLDVESGLFLDLAAGRVLQRLAELEQPARQRPLALSRLMRALDDERLAVAHHDRADANDRMRGIFSGHMKSHTEYLTFNIPARMGFENITPKVDAAVAQERRHGRPGAGQRDAHHRVGLHQRRRARACIKDYAKWLETLAPFDASPERYAHNRTGEDNADAHMKRQIMGREVVSRSPKGQLDFRVRSSRSDGSRNVLTAKFRWKTNSERVPRCLSDCVRDQSGNEAAAFRSAGANWPAASWRMPAAAIIAALSVDSDRRGM